MDNIDHFLRICNQVRLSGMHNFQKCKIPVNYHLNFQFLREILIDYDDSVVCDFLQYGWPVGHSGSPFSSAFKKNHKGATDFPEDIKNYFKKELKYNAVLGPFKSNPFDEDIAISPINSVPKKDSKERRVIVDLSYPENNSVNDGISKDFYLGNSISVSYPTVDDFVKLIKSKGKGCKIFKKDLKRAYRQLNVDPGDIHLLGYKWKGHLYFDKVLTMGLRSAAYICMRTTDAIKYICQKFDISILNYLDDLAGCELSDRSDYAFDQLGKLLVQCGFEESIEKASPPDTKMLFIGILFDTLNFTISIDENRLAEILDLVLIWLQKEFTNKRELQSLLGKLNFVSQCVRPGRIFVSRMLNFLREIPDNGQILIPDDLKRDLKWWQTYLPLYNDVSMMISEEWANPDEFFSVDACLTGCGGWMNGRFFHCTFPDFILEQHLNINLCEMLTLVIAVKIWGRYLANKKVTIYCDNMVSVRVLNTGASRNSFLQACLREICFVSALNNCEIKGKHICGVDNRIPDLLSRWDLDSKYKFQFHLLTKDMTIFEDKVLAEMFNFSHEW